MPSTLAYFIILKYMALIRVLKQIGKVGFPFLFLFAQAYALSAQSIKLKGQVMDSLRRPIVDAWVVALPDSIATTTNAQGEFQLTLRQSSSTEVVASHLQYVTKSVRWSGENPLVIVLSESERVLEEVEVNEKNALENPSIGVIDLKAESIYTMPSATGDFSQVLATLPGVVTNSELATVYSVRGGNYDENLVYVNGMKIYRPFLVSAGRQEGLSFINPDLVGGVQFSAGGWQAKYGDKLSSVLRVNYRKPTANRATINLSLLGGSLYYGGINKAQDFAYAIGVRHQNSRYLLNTLEVKGQYFPRFTDLQAYLYKSLSKNTTAELLFSSAYNDYLTLPTSQETVFGTIQQVFRMNVAFEGREQLSYQTHQMGLMFTHAFHENFIAKATLSGVHSAEREYYEVEGGYRLCELDENPASDRFNECLTTLGLGTNYHYGRNRLKANIMSATQSNEVYIDNDLLEFGVSWEYQHLSDRLKEYAFVDSADFAKVTRSVDNAVNVQTHLLGGFMQYALNSSDFSHALNVGIRLNYRTLNGEWLMSPRLQYAYKTGLHQATTLRLSTGLYRQYPFYRELRDRQGSIHTQVKAQSSWHLVAGLDRQLRLWGRPFKFSADLYYKYLWHVNPYELHNIRIRYFATNQAKAYAYGADFRINGEFIPGTESWFSLGWLSTREDLGQGQGYVRRPSDRRINVGVFFQDHIPNDSSLKVNVRMVLGSGLPFGPPARDDLRNRLTANEYYRIDLGFSKTFTFKPSVHVLIPRSLWVGIEVLNALGINNTIAYTWIQDLRGRQFAVPNGLSARLLNLRLIAKF